MTLPAPADLGLTAGGSGEAGRDMGWHADPWQRHQLRFHDGAQWTEHVADGGFCGLDSAPVADLPRSHPRPPQEAPPDHGDGPRVVPDDDRRPVSLDRELLLLGRHEGRRRALLGPDDSVAGWIEQPRPEVARRLLGLLASDPGDPVTRLVVTDGEGGVRLRLSRPARRMAPLVDLDGPDGLRGTVRAEGVRQGLRAEVRAGDGVVGRLEQTGPRRTDLHVVDIGGAPIARLAAVWDVPGGRRHLPPGVLLVDRRPPGGGPLDPRLGPLLLGALLAAELLLPPPPPSS
ncbi:MAG TPA: hypothetical protein VK507_17950 [Iamia sp.]|nr:hypothetical protein [Iamia sp.]